MTGLGRKKRGCWKGFSRKAPSTQQGQQEVTMEQGPRPATENSPPNTAGPGPTASKVDLGSPRNLASQNRVTEEDVLAFPEGEELSSTAQVRTLQIRRQQGKPSAGRGCEPQVTGAARAGPGGLRMTRPGAAGSRGHGHPLQPQGNLISVDFVPFYLLELRKEVELHGRKPCSSQTTLLSSS